MKIHSRKFLAVSEGGGLVRDNLMRVHCTLTIAIAPNKELNLFMLNLFGECPM
jgi:hypothetical protein